MEANVFVYWQLDVEIYLGVCVCMSTELVASKQENYVDTLSSRIFPIIGGTATFSSFESRTVSFDPLQVSSSEPAVPMQALLVGMLLGRMDSMAIEASRNGLRLVTGPASITAERMESMALCLLEARIYFAGLEQKYGAVAEAEQGCITRGSFSQVSFKQCLLLCR